MLRLGIKQLASLPKQVLALRKSKCRSGGNNWNYNSYNQLRKHSKPRVLLQTATAIATNEEGTRSTKVRVLFGSVSQRSYVAESLRSRLQLISLQSEKINLNTFGESKFRKQTQIQKAEPSEDDVLANSVKRFWDTESVGISDITANDEELFEIDVRRKGNCYEVKFPWKENTQPSSNGYQLSESRLRSLHHKLRKEASLLAEYDAIIQEQMKSGIVEKVPDEYLTNQETSQNYYLPHVAVII